MLNISNFLDSINEIVEEKQIKKEIIFEGIIEGIKKAYEKFFDPEAIIEVDINEGAKKISVWKVLTVVDEVEDEWLEISKEDATKKYKVSEIGAQVKEPVDINGEFSHLAVSKVSQTIKQKIRDAEKGVIYDKFINKIGELSGGIVKDMTEKSLLVTVDGLTIPFWNMKLIPGESFGVGQRVIFYIENVDRDNKYQQVDITRIHPNFIRKVLEIEVPEIESGIVEIMNVVREPGFRAKVSVRTNDPNIDPISCCIGQGGSRIKSVVKELGKERVDMVLHDEDQQTYILNALSPARVISIEKTDEENNHYTVIVPNEHLSLAIGRGGNVIKLVAKLVGAKIDIVSFEQAKERGINIFWNGNLTEDELESGKWLQEKNFRNWSKNAKPYTGQQQKQQIDFEDYKSVNVDELDDLVNRDEDEDDDFYNQDHEDYLADEDDDLEN